MKKNLLLLGLFVTVFSACTKEANEPAPEVMSGQKTITIEAILEDTKTTESSAVFSWSEGETISIGSNTYGYRKYYDFSTVSGDGKFTGTIDEGALSDVIVAVSPAQNNDNKTPGSLYSVYSATQFAVTLPDTYNYSPGVTNAVLVGENKADNSIFKFKQAAALFKVKYENIPTTAVAVRLTADQNITGTVTPGSRDNPSIALGDSNLNGNNVTITFNSSNIEGLNSSEYFYFPVPHGTYGSIQLELLDNGYQVIDGSVRTLSSGLTLNRGDVYTVPTITLYNAQRIGSDNPYDSVSNTGFFTIKDGQVLHMKFTNHTKGEAIWQNWVMDINDATANHFLSICPDNREGSLWCVSPKYSSIHNKSQKTEWIVNNTNDQTESWDDNVFISIMEGAEVTIAVEYYNNVFMISTSAVNASVGKTAYMTYYAGVDSSSAGTLSATLRCDQSYFDFDNIWKTKSNPDAGLTSAETYYIYDSELSISNVRVPDSALIKMSDGTQITLEVSKYDISEVSGSLAVPLSETGFSRISGAKIGDVSTSLVIPLKKGIGACGTQSFDAEWWGWFANYKGTLPNVNDSKAITMYVYSSLTDMYSHPYTQLATKEDAGLNEDYVVVRMDNWGFKDATGYPAYSFGDGNTSHDWIWGDGFAHFKEYQNRAIVKSTVTRTSSDTASIRYDVTYRNGETHYQEYRNIAVGENLAYRFSAPKCYVIVIDYE